MNKNRKTNSQLATKSTTKIDCQGRRIFFSRKVFDQQKSEADLMLALNEASQKASKGLDTQFSQVRYAPSEAISALFTKKTNRGLLIPRLSNPLIWTVKTVDFMVVGVEIRAHWHWLKIHGMSLARYLGGRKIDVLKREVKSSTGI